MFNWSEDRIYRPDGIGAKLLDRENLAAELSGRKYSDESTGKILGGNMMRVLRSVLVRSSLPKQLFGQLNVSLTSAGSDPILPDKLSGPTPGNDKRL